MAQDAVLQDIKKDAQKKDPKKNLSCMEREARSIKEQSESMKLKITKLPKKTIRA